ncbi:hypothetical protein I551_3309 [Mycobacterium ulcerans str. Harvey]|uniref:Uncharacterized protein n=1 Tax=Mycobacterium ulcerans str. Harvey TaxID=1299332 RepID=A0ABN0QZJ3_MYCUL|nr:hypothetical protein I551_3309 [Mycobacterium ulcerans str. Harvey]
MCCSTTVGNDQRRATQNSVKISRSAAVAAGGPGGCTWISWDCQPRVTKPLVGDQAESGPRWAWLGGRSRVIQAFLKGF